MRDIVFYVLGFITGVVATIAFLYFQRIVTKEAIEERIAEMQAEIERLEQTEEE